MCPDASNAAPEIGIFLRKMGVEFQYVFVKCRKKMSKNGFSKTTRSPGMRFTYYLRLKFQMPPQSHAPDGSTVFEVFRNFLSEKQYGKGAIENPIAEKARPNVPRAVASSLQLWPRRSDWWKRFCKKIRDPQMQ